MNGSIYPMNVSKPETPEELYQFFIKGISLKPSGHCFRFDHRRKGWNVYTNFIKTNSYEGIILKFYSYNAFYRPDWTLKEYEYAKTN